MKIAIIAHDGKKAEMVRFLSNAHEILKQEGIKLIATGTTGSHVVAGGLEVERVASGPMGGDAQIAAQITEGKMLMRICDVHNVPLATNPATAELILKGL